MPGTARITPTETIGFDGGSRMTSASAIASSTPGAGFDVRRSDRDDRLGRQRRAVAHPPLLEVDGAPAGIGLVDRHVGLHPVVAHRQQGDARLPARRRAPSSPPRAGSPRRASGCGRDGWRDRGRRGRTRPGPTPYALSSSRTAKVSPTRPQPRSSSRPPPSVYMIVSRSGQMRRPCSDDVIAGVDDRR